MLIQVHVALPHHTTIVLTNVYSFHFPLYTNPQSTPQKKIGPSRIKNINHTQ